MLGLKAFVAAVLGGIGIIPGAMLGGIVVIGIVESLSKAYMGTLTGGVDHFGVFGRHRVRHPDHRASGQTRRAFWASNVGEKV